MHNLVSAARKPTPARVKTAKPMKTLHRKAGGEALDVPDDIFD